ncbi:hypothetical protein [Streptomyces sp. SID4920]|uniref:hypothetical protein n=1 Tax=Streptomyces sp. SID4920 TaxID=2690271 RepID=UPI000372C167|nr:hypothetical protein [Streptomyces sp. SID4920]MYS37227.1 hypothetical protein [Streptomyces sp. SID4920]
MSRIIRTLAVSGAAAAALLGTATVASADDSADVPASVQAAADHAAGTPVSLPDGRVIHVTGLDSVSYRADAAHRTAVVTLADGLGDTRLTGNQPEVNGIGTGLVENPQGQMQTQASAGGMSTVAVAALAIGIIVFFGLKSGKIAKGWFVVSVIFGVLLSGTLVGPMVSQLTGSGVTMFGNFWAGM